MATALIEVDEKVAAALKAQADLRRLSVPDFLNQIATNAAPINKPERLSDQEWEAAMDEITDSMPILPTGFSREDIYFDHD
jgi:hypothetical protein